MKNECFVLLLLQKILFLKYEIYFFLDENILDDFLYQTTYLALNCGFDTLKPRPSPSRPVALLDYDKSQRKDQTHRNLVPVAILEVMEDGPIKVTHYTSDDSSYADVLKPHSIISIKGLGSKMVGPYYVTAIRHKIASSDESVSSQRIRCTNCGNENEKSDKFCRNCGNRIIS